MIPALLIAVGNVLISIINIYQLLIVIWALASWFPAPQSGVVGDLLSAINLLVDPYVALFRRFIPPIANVDFSPLIAYFALSIVQWLIGVIL